MSATRICSLLLAAAALSACSERPSSDPVAPSTANAAVTPSSAADGATIIRRTPIEFIVLFDAQSQLLSVHMPSDVCLTFDLNTAELLQVRTPSELGQIINVLKSGDARVSVYHATSPEEAGFSGPISLLGFGNLVDFDQLCAFLAGPGLIAEGTVHRISTASNASFHERATGVLEGVDGNPYHLTEVYQLNMDAHDPADPAGWVERIADVELSRLP